MFEKSLNDLVRGIRNNKKNEAAFIGQCLQEIKEEIKTNDLQKKTVAIQKLTYLQMIGYEMGWAAFNIIEVMSSVRFTQKRIGYLAASQSFTQDTDVIMLATHLIRKDMTSSNIYEAGIAIDCLSNICTPDLARDLAADVVTLLNSSRPYIRKKACLVLYKIFLRFPDALRPSFPRLKEKLEDPDPSVQSAAVNVICELARKNPKNYIGLSPALFKILTSSTNNWMLIKIIKLFGILLPIENRLAKKLAGPLANFINTTPAMSLLYECIQTCTIGLADHVPTIKLCISKLRNFVEDPDQNLKYLGLVALSNIMKIHPKAVAEHRDLVITCLDDEDTTIRMRALDLIEGMVSKKNLLDIIRKLLDHIEKSDNATYKEAMVEKIVTICSKNSYQYITDFEWYISVLIELCKNTGTKQGTLIGSQYMDVIIRVRMIRAYGVKAMIGLLREPRFLIENPTEGEICEVLYSAAWIVGEFCNFITNPLPVIDALLQSGVALLPAHIQGVYMQAGMKIFATVVSEGSVISKYQIGNDEESSELPTMHVDENIKGQVIKMIQSRLPIFTQSHHLEVQERACFIGEILNIYNDYGGDKLEIGKEIASLFDEPLNPVAPKAQKKVPIPEGLDLDEWINEPPEVEELENNNDFGFLKDDSDSGKEKKSLDPEEEDKRREAMRLRYLNNPHYLPSGPSQSTNQYVDDVDDIPIQRLTKEDLQGSKRDTSSPFYLGGIKPPKKTKKSVSIMKSEEMPEGAEESDGELDSDKHDGLRADIDWNEPIKELPKQTHRITQNILPVEEKKTKKKGEKTKKKDGTKKKIKKNATPTAEPEKLIDFGFEDISSPPAPTKDSGLELNNTKTKTKPKKKVSSKKSKDDVKKNKSKKDVPNKKSEMKTVTKPTSKAPAATSPVVTKPAQRFRPLCSDENLSVLYETRVNPNESKKFLCVFALKNRSQNVISNIQIDVKGTLSTKISSGSPAKVEFSLEPDQSNTFNLLFDVQAIELPQKLNGIFSYTVEDTSASKEFIMTLPCSSFILPVKLSAEDFFDVIKNNPLQLASTDVRPEGEFKNFIVNLATLLRVELITMDNKAATLYGKSIQGHHVALYIKTPTQGSPVHVDIKCSSSPFGTSLASEISSAFPK